MYLKRIEVKGFKSFADKVELDFGKGITAIVGPNGSGKSNISDAIRWVLGEQSAKTLRGGKMEDVIFIGTENRKSLGFAEVSLTIDNTSNMLPLEYTEVTVTRRLYRSGESEYLINNSSCRLKDIVELFMDTGIGKDGYSLIGQGKIDEILSTKSEDRRNIFEEAAGIVKYKARKLEAEKKLDNTKQNITRVTDIIEELENQIEPLREQSQTAKQYLGLKEELKELEVNVILHNFENAKKKLDKINFDINELSENNKILDEKKQALVLEIENLKNDMHLLISEFEKTSNSKFEAEKNLENRQGSLKLLEERKENYEREKSRLEKELHESEEQIEVIDSGEQRILEDKDKTLVELNTRKNTIDKINGEYINLSEKCTANEAAVDNKKSDMIQLLKDISDINNRINTANIMLENLSSRKKQLYKDNEVKNQGLSLINNEIENINKNINELNKEIGNLKAESANLNNEINGLQEKGRMLNEKRNKCFDRLRTFEARYNTLSDMERDMEGFNRAVKSIISSYKDYKKVFGVVSDLIQVPKGYEIAIEIALGAAVQNIVTNNEETTGFLINYLKKNNLGRATFLPLTTIRPRDITLKADLKAFKGFLGVASEIVKYDARFNNVVSNLLGRVLICDNLDNAGALAKSIDYSYRIVTLEGDVVNTGGSFTGGSVGSKGSGIFSRKNELEELNKSISNERINLSSAEAESGINSQEIIAKRDQLEKIGLEIQNRTINLQTEYNRQSSLTSQKRSYNDEIKDINIEINQIEMESVKNSEMLEENKEKLETLNQTQAEIESEIEALQSDYKRCVIEKDKTYEVLTNEKIAYAEINKSLEAVNNKLTSLKQERNNYIQKKQSHDYALRENELKTAETINSIKVNLDEINEVKSSIEIIKEILSKIDEDKKAKSEEINFKEKNLKNVEEDINTAVMSVHRQEISKSKLEAETEMFVNKLWEDYELSIPQAAKYRRDLNSISEANRKLNELKQSIRELGDVNVNSIEEYKRVTERYDFLSIQKEDLIKAEESLIEVILEITKKMEQQFQEGFKVIREYFNSTFKELFGGGYADLRLEGDDILNSGIEIIVQPPGKKLQSLSLLSGGERGLAAIALVFAILKMKPTPFCVLDEIEAALDDANVNRFAKFLRVYSNNTQFIMITHRKGSMAVADALYGVTMEEKGVSKIISLKLKEEAKYGLAR